MEEPSVLDYVKSLLMPWKGPRIRIPRPEQAPTPLAAETADAAAAEVVTEPPPVLEEGLTVLPAAAAAEMALVEVVPPAPAAPRYQWPWRSLAALLLALLAQDWAWNRPAARLAPRWCCTRRRRVCWCGRCCGANGR